MKKMVVFLVILLLSSMVVPEAMALNVVTTMPNLWNVADEIGGTATTIKYVAPSTAIHISSDTIDALLQQNSEFIGTADVFLGQGGGMDDAVIIKITEFCTKNFGESIKWQLLDNVSKNVIPNATTAYDDPTALLGYSETVAYLLSIADPPNTSVYQTNLNTYLKKIVDATRLTTTEKATLANIPIICHFRIKNQTVNWLGMNCIDSYPRPTTIKDLIDDIHENPSKYRIIAEKSSNGKIIIIENVIAGPDMGISIHEALIDVDVPCERITFLNLPKSTEDVGTILDYYAYNKNLVLSLSQPDAIPAIPAPTKVPFEILTIIAGIIGVIFLRWRA
jgi:ABC-type Zn uptake system ZnuABC Zn-binding protein ZnuA